MAINSITDFIQEIGRLGGASHKNLFVLEISMPSGLGKYTNRSIALLASSLNIPDMRIGSDDNISRYGYGPVYNSPWGTVFNDIPVELICDSSGYTSGFITDWLNLIVPFNSTGPITKDDGETIPFFVNYPDKYATTVKIKTYDVTGKEVAIFTLYDAWPNMMSSENLSYDSHTYSTVRFNLTFVRWTVEYSKNDNRFIQRDFVYPKDKFSVDKYFTKLNQVLNQVGLKMPSAISDNYNTIRTIGNNLPESYQQYIERIDDNVYSVAQTVQREINENFDIGSLF